MRHANRLPAQRLQELQELWRRVVGEEIAEQSGVVRYRRGVLTVQVSSAPLLAELSGFAQEQLLNELNIGGLKELHHLRFVTG